MALTRKHKPRLHFNPPYLQEKYMSYCLQMSKYVFRTRHVCQGQRQFRESKILYAVQRLVNFGQSWPTVTALRPRLQTVLHDVDWWVRGAGC
jgi:hypothetical protein